MLKLHTYGIITFKFNTCMMTIKTLFEIINDVCNHIDIIREYDFVWKIVIC